MDSTEAATEMSGWVASAFEQQMEDIWTDRDDNKIEQPVELIDRVRALTLTLTSTPLSGQQMFRMDETLSWIMSIVRTELFEMIDESDPDDSLRTKSWKRPVSGEPRARNGKRLRVAWKGVLAGGEEYLKSEEHNSQSYELVVYRLDNEQMLDLVALNAQGWLTCVEPEMTHIAPGYAVKVGIWRHDTP